MDALSIYSSLARVHWLLCRFKVHYLAACVAGFILGRMI